jgi:hypothetical protein
MASLRNRAKATYAETYLTTLPIMSPSLGGAWMQMGPKALWARLVHWVTNPSSREASEEGKDPSVEKEWAEDIVPCLLDPDEPRFINDAQVAHIINERLSFLERNAPLSDEERQTFMWDALLSLSWA